MKIPFSALLEEKPFLGTFVQSGSPEFLEAAGYAGFRYIAVDLEHTYYGVERTAEMIRAGEAADLCMLARVPALDAVWIKSVWISERPGSSFPTSTRRSRRGRRCACAASLRRVPVAPARASAPIATAGEARSTTRSPIGRWRSFPWWSPPRGCATSLRSWLCRGSRRCSWDRSICRWPWAGAAISRMSRCAGRCWI